MIVLAFFNETEKTLLSRIYSKNFKLLWHIAFKMTHHREDADDMVQNTMTRLAGHTSKLASLNEKALDYYCIRTIKNLCCSEYRRKIREDRKLNRVVQTPEEAPVEVAERKLESEEVRLCLGKLKERDRKLLTYKFYHEYSNKEISKMMNIPTKQVSTYMERAKKQLLKIITKRGKLHEQPNQ